jgi:PAP2 superfamily
VATPSQPVVFPVLANKHALETPYRLIQTASVMLILILIAALFRLESSPYVSFAFAGAFVMHMLLRPNRRELAVVVGAAAVFSVSYSLHHGTLINFYGDVIAIPGGFLGMGSLLLVTMQWFWAPDSAKSFHRERAHQVALIPALCVCSLGAVNLAAQVTPITYDRLLYAFDVKFGGPPSWVIGRLLRAHPWLFEACGYVYNSLPLGLATCLAIQWRDRQRNLPIVVDLRWLSVALGVTGFALYQVCPAAGPVYLFGEQFPLQVPSLASFAIQPAWLAPVARNGMPSLHVGWTLLLFWNLRRRSWWMGALSACYLLLTALATLGSGEHYLVDLMVAPPLALAIQGACTRTTSSMRWMAVAVGGAITLSWLFAFRSGAALAIPAGAATWLIALATVAVPGIVAWRLERSVE